MAAPVRLCLLLLALLLVGAHAVRPKVANATVQVASGSLAGNDVTLAEFEAIFDQDLHLLEVTDCVDTGCVPNNTACACDYTSKNSTLCGVSPTGCQCDKSFCDTTVVDDWIPIQIGVPYRGQIPFAFTTQQLRVYLPIQDSCKALHIRLTQHSGDTDLYVTNDLTNPPTGGPYLAADTLANLGYANNDSPGGFPWFSFRSKGDQTILCPGERWNDDPTIDNYQSGTYYIQVQTYAYPGDYTIYTYLYDIKPNWNLLQAQQNKWPVPVDCAVTKQQYPTHECLGEDELVGSKDWVADYPDDLTYYVKQMEGPCPHLYAFVGMDGPATAYRLYARPNGIDPNFTFVDAWTPPELPDGQLVNHDGLIVMDDFNRGYVAFSVCPAVGNRSTVFFLVRRSDDSAGQWYRRFFTVNPNRFRATPLSQIGPLSEQSFVTLETIDFKTTDGQPVPDVSDPNGIIYPCTYEGGGQCQNLYCTVTAATNESTPMFPPPMSSRRNVLPGQTFPEPAFLAAENISTRNDRVMRATLLISLDYTNGFNAARLNAVPRDAIARLQFRFPNYRLVNDLFESVEVDSWRNPATKKAVCSIDDYNTVLQSIGATEEGLASAQTLPGLNDQLSQIDYLAWRPAYLGCESLTQSLLNNFTNNIVINERNCLSNQPGAVSTGDPCCFNLFNWGQCCLAKPTLITVSTYQPTPTANALQGACGDGSNCVYTYLEDYARSANAVCRPQLSEKIYKESYAFWVACTDQVFGQYLRGRNCTTDADCTTIGSTPSNASYCEFANVYQKWTPDPEQRKYGQCVTPYPDLVDAFLDCFIEQGSLLSILVLENLNVTGATTVELRNNLKQVPSLLSADCNANTNAAFAPLDPDSSSNKWTGQTHWIWNINGARFLCDSTRSPKMLHGSAVYLSFFEAPLSCWRAGLQNDVGSVQSAVIRSSSQTDCEGARVCNYGDYAAFYGSDAATLGAQCNSTYTQSCAVCRPDGTHCQTVPAAVVAAFGGACPTEVCYNVDGTITLPSNGACPSTCTVPCRDSNYNPIPCPDQQACESAGRCTDEGVFVNATGTDGACLTEGNSYHKPSCLASSRSPRLTVLDLNAGCVFRRDSAARCATRSGNPRWIPRSARSQAECAAYGCGCTKPAVAITELGQLITAVSSVPASPEECDACGSAACVPYFSWIPGRWVAGTLHSAAVVAPQVVTPFTWKASTFDFTKLSAKLESTILFLYSQQTKSSAQCRFNKIAPSIQAVSLACTTNPEIDQIRNIQNELPIGVGVPCGGAALQISAPPNTIYFRSDSVAPLGYCPSVQIFNVPADSFGSAASSKQLSTYFTKKRRGAQGRTLEFANAKGALIGQVLASGIRVTPDNATLVASRVRLCLNGGVQIAALDKKFDRYPVFDIAEQQGGLLVPLRVNVTNDATLGQCAELPRVTATTYVPVIRLEGEFEKVEPPKLTKGEKTILFLACAAYFITAGYAVYHMVLIVLAATLIPFYLLPPFWMASMLALANTIRGIYFALIGSEQIAESNVADIILFELPTFMWFTATTLVVLLWISIGSARKQKEIGPKFRVLFLVSNGVMYLLFILFVVLFSVLKDKKKVDKICGDRLPVKFDRTQREVLFIVYQCFLAVVALLLSAAFLFGGIKLIKLLRSSKKNPNAPLSADELKLLMLAIVCGLSFAAHAVFVFVLAIVQPGIAYLVVILVVLECLPSAYLLWNLPTRTKQASGTGSTSASGSASAR